MNIDVVQVVLGSLVLGFAGLLQSAVGFGYAVFAIPLLVFLGVPLQNSLVIVASCATFQSIMAANHLRASVPWRLALNCTFVRMANIIIGVFFLRKMLTFEPADIKAVVGGIICVLVLVQFLWKPHPSPAVHWVWAGLSWSLSGIISGTCGMGGPPLVLWLMAHDWSSIKTRSFLFAVIATSTPFQIALLCGMFGFDMLKSLGVGIASFPIVYLGYRLGLPIGNRIAKPLLRRIALILLFIIGFGATINTLKNLVF